MIKSQVSGVSTVGRDWVADLTAGVVVFLVALPLCLGIAFASNAPLISGVLAGIVGGIVVGLISGSHSSVSGPAAGLTAVVAAQIHSVGSFEGFLLAVMFAGFLQIILGVSRCGFVAKVMPSSVIQGLLAAIGIILIMKQTPVVVGYMVEAGDPSASSSFIGRYLSRIHLGAALIGIFSILFIFIWDSTKTLKKLVLPAPLVVVVLGTVFSQAIGFSGYLAPLEPNMLVQVPVPESLNGIADLFALPDFYQINNPAVYLAAATIAAVASLETLLNLEAVDKLDPMKRSSPPNRELLAQGVGNMVSGLIGGLPLTSVIVRSSVNLGTGAKTKASAIFHGILLLFCVVMLPKVLNLIPLSCLAAILITTGVKLASPGLVYDKWAKGKNQFIPFTVTVVAIVLNDLLVGIIAGLVIQQILNSWEGAPLASAFKSRTDTKDRPDGSSVVAVFGSMTYSNWSSIKARIISFGIEKTVLVDLSEARFIDSTAMEKLHELEMDFRRAGGSLRVEGLAEHKPETSHPTASRRRLVPPPGSTFPPKS
ncbi:MAG: SulP family inorganic anion transporter [Planctomycetota bacterium]